MLRATTALLNIENTINIHKLAGAQGCGTNSGICQSCIDYNISAPYWNYTGNLSKSSCRSCANINSRQPYFDQYNRKCVSWCPDSAPAVNLGMYQKTYDYACRKCSDIYPTAKVPLYWNPNSRECVVRCPAQTPERLSTGVCKACNEISSTSDIWDLTTEKCVPSCPSGAYVVDVKVYDVNYTCTTCYLQFGVQCPYSISYNNSVALCDTCGSIFTQGVIWNPNTEKCVSECSAQTPAYTVNGSTVCRMCSETYNVSSYWNGSSCVYCPESTPNWNQYTHTCEASCPDDAPVWNGHVCTICPIAYPDSGIPFWNPNAKVCVQTCPSITPEKNKSNSCYLCYEFDSSKPFWNGTQCTICAEADVSRPAWNSKTKACEPCANSYPNSPYWDGTKCVATCPEAYDFQKVCQRCAVVDRNKPVLNNITNICDTCANVRPDTPYQNGTECVHSCPETHNKEGVCKTCEEMYGSIGRQLWNGEKCMSCSNYDASTPVWDSSSKKCVSCPENTPNWNTRTEQCQEKCQANAPYWNGTSCTSCAAVNPNRPYWNGTACIPFCSPGIASYDASENCKQCYDLDSETPFWNGLQCVSCLDANQSTPVWSITNKNCEACATVYPDQPYWNGSNCVSACPEAYDTKQTCQSCASLFVSSGKQYWNGKSCVSCFEGNPETPIWDQDSRTCTACPINTPNWNVLTNQCQQSCGTDKPFWNGTNCVLCNDAGLKRNDDGACVSNCDKWVLDEDTGDMKCVNKCPHWWYTEIAGFCQNDEWKNATVITLFVGIILILGLGAVLTLILIKKCICPCKESKGSELLAPGPYALQVANVKYEQVLSDKLLDLGKQDWIQ